MHHRPAVDAAVRRPVEDERGPTFRLKADRRDACTCSHGVAPGAGGVDHDRRAVGAGRRLRVPEAARTRERRHRRLRHQRSATRAQASQKTLMQGGDVDLLRLRLQNRAGDIVLTQRYGLLPEPDWRRGVPESAHAAGSPRRSDRACRSDRRDRHTELRAELSSGEAAKSDGGSVRNERPVTASPFVSGPP